MLGQHGVDSRVGVKCVARTGQIHAGGVHSAGARKRQAFVPRAQRQGRNEVRTGRRPLESDLCRRIAFEQETVGVQAIVETSRIGVIRRHPVIDREAAQTGKACIGLSRIGRALASPDDERAAVDVQESLVLVRWIERGRDHLV
jgi:hypothetical protein